MLKPRNSRRLRRQRRQFAFRDQILPKRLGRGRFEPVQIRLNLAGRSVTDDNACDGGVQKRKLKSSGGKSDGVPVADGFDTSNLVQHFSACLAIVEPRAGNSAGRQQPGVEWRRQQNPDPAR
jgi:hypothetical protein